MASLDQAEANRADVLQEALLPPRIPFSFKVLSIRHVYETFKGGCGQRDGGSGSISPLNVSLLKPVELKHMSFLCPVSQ